MDITFRSLLLTVMCAGLIGAPAAGANDLHTEATGRCGLIFLNRWDPELRKQATFSVRPTGDDLTRLTPWRRTTGAVAVSPDARYIIGSRYERETDSYKLIKTSTEGGRWKRFTPKDEASYGDVAISPNSNFVAFNRSEGVNDTNLYVMDVKTREMTLVTEDAQFGRWAGSSDRLVYSGLTGELLERNFDLFTIDRNGSDVVQITNTTEDDEFTGGVYSPDASRILFERYPKVQQNENDGPYADVWVIDRDGSNERQLTDRQDDLNGVENPQWSPDGTRISYDFVNDGFRGVVTARPDGSDDQLITERGDGFSGNGLFSPNGEKVIVSVQDDNENDLLMARADGSNERWFMRSSRFGDHAVAWPSC